MSETEALMILNAIDGLSNRRVHQLIQTYGSGLDILKLNANDWREIKGIKEQTISRIMDFPRDKFLRNEYEFAGNNTRIIKYTDDEYSPYLRQIADAPVVLYVQGQLPEHHRSHLAIVGSRRASLYGLSIAEKFAMRLSERGICVVSGLARGIDTAAHRGSVRACGPSVGVLGCGLSVQYPRENQDLRERMLEFGAVVSEFPMQTQPLPYNFPRRNRIVSGLSLGVIVVEAALKSGALITADFALEQGREVYAVPGPVDSPNSRGVHALVRQGAQLVTSIDEILEEYEDRMCEAEQQSSPAADRPHLSEDENHLYQFVTDKPIHIDELVSLSQTDISTATTLLFQMELKNHIKQLPGKRFKR